MFEVEAPLITLQILGDDDKGSCQRLEIASNQCPLGPVGWLQPENIAAFRCAQSRDGCLHRLAQATGLETLYAPDRIHRY